MTRDRVALPFSIAATMVLVACGHEWDDYDPRVAGHSADAAGSGGQASTSTSSDGAAAGNPSTGPATGGSSAAGGGTAAAGGGGASAPVDLVAAYSFDEGAGTAVMDATSYQNHGVVNGATWVAGKHGGALQFDGDDDVVRVPADPTWKEDGLTDYTFMAWVQVNDPFNYRGALAVGAWADNSVALSLQNGEWTFNVTTVGGPSQWVCGAASGPLPYLETPDGEFHHITGVLDADAGVCHLYVDGQLAGTDDYVDGTISFGPGDLMVGGFDGSNYLGCVVDDVRVYKRALGNAEIQADMAEPVAD